MSLSIPSHSFLSLHNFKLNFKKPSTLPSETIASDTIFLPRFSLHSKEATKRDEVYPACLLVNQCCSNLATGRRVDCNSQNFPSRHALGKFWKLKSTHLSGTKFENHCDKPMFWDPSNPTFNGEGRPQTKSARVHWPKRVAIIIHVYSEAFKSEVRNLGFGEPFWEFMGFCVFFKVCYVYFRVSSYFFLL